jgi:hypothetical protein
VPGRTLVLTPKGHGFVPARLADNPYIDQDAYRKRMSGFTDPVMRERMLNGDWSVMPNTKISAEWLREYDMQGQMIRLYRQDGQNVAAFHEQECSRFVTVDTAGSTKDITRESKGKPHSWSVAGVWDFKRLGDSAALIARTSGGIGSGSSKCATGCERFTATGSRLGSSSKMPRWARTSPTCCATSCRSS